MTYSFSSDAGGAFATATELPFNTPHTETLGLDGDLADCYKLTLTNGIFQIIGSVSTTLKAKASFYNSDGKKAASLSISGGKFSMKPATLAAGTYYLMLESRDGGRSTGEYTLSVTGTEFPAASMNNTLHDATRLPQSPAGNAETEGWVGLGDSIDYYRIDPDRAGTLFVSVTGLSAKVKVTLYRADGKKIKSVSLSKDSSDVFKGGYLLDGAAYLSIESGDNGKGKQNTSYTLDIRDNYFPVPTDNNSTEAADTVAFAPDGSASVAGWVGFGDASDFYRIDPGRAGTLFVSVTGLSAKVKVTLYRADGKKIKSVSLSKDSTDVFKGGYLLENAAYLAVESGDKGKGKQNTAYNLTINDRLFPEATADNSIGAAGRLDLDENGHASVDGWVGFGDAADFYRIDPESAGRLYVGVSGLSARVKLTLYRADGKKLKSVTLSKDNSDAFKGGYLLEAGTACLSVESGDSGKGKQNTSYTLTVNDHLFPEATADNSVETAEWIDLDAAGNATVSGWVGYGDAADCYRIDPLYAGSVSVKLSNVTDKLKLTIYSQGKKIKTLTVKQGSGSLDNLILPAMPVYLSVESGDKGKGKLNSSYTLDITDRYSAAPADNNDRTTATRMNWDEEGVATVADAVGFDDPVDYFRFELENACSVDLNLIPDNPEIEVGKQLKVALYNEAGKKIKLDSGFRSGELDAAVYFVEVEISSPKKYSTGYRLDVQQLA